MPLLAFFFNYNPEVNHRCESVQVFQKIIVTVAGDGVDIVWIHVRDRFQKHGSLRWGHFAAWVTELDRDCVEDLIFPWKGSIYFSSIEGLARLESP